MFDDLLEEPWRGPLPPWLDERVRVLRSGPRTEGEFVLYWMRTAVRGHENPALDVALHIGAHLDLPVFVYHALSERYPYASDRHHRFILEGARDVAFELSERQIGYAFHLERPGHRGPALIDLAARAALVVTEDFPTPPMRAWTQGVLERSDAGVWVVDTACVVPMRMLASAPTRAFSYRDATREWRGERVSRPWPEYDGGYREFVPTDLPYEPFDLASADLGEAIARCDIDHGVAPVPDTPGGSAAGYERWEEFVGRGLGTYDKRRNDPAIDGTSRMSAYLHYGHVSPLRLARDAAARRGSGPRKFLDELMVWRELAYTWCLHREDPESVASIPAWARKTLAEHEGDRRDPLSWERLARGSTGDPLWDLAQRSLLAHGELHNNLRMTWAKAIVPWSPDTETALARLIDLNHRYALDGRDPASYGGLLWCLGLFDRPMPGPGPVLGTVRGRSLRAQAGRIDLLGYRGKVARPRWPGGNAKIAVVGAGIAGLACARSLTDHGLEVVVFDKGRGPGGRACSRRVASPGEDSPARHVDHGAQFFRARSESLRRHVRSWVDDGVVAAWSPRTADGADLAERAPLWVGTPSMGAIGQHLARGLDVRSGARIESLERRPGGWQLGVEGGGESGPFDSVVVALPAPQAAVLLGDHSWADRLARVRIAPCLAVAARFDGNPSVDFDVARPDGDAPLGWIAREASKPGRSPDGWWMLHASAAWSRTHLEDRPEEIARALVAWCDQEYGLGTPVETFTQRWRYALVEEPLGEDCLFDPEQRLLACGDGCMGGRLEAAWESGIAAAGRLLGDERTSAIPLAGEI